MAKMLELCRNSPTCFSMGCYAMTTVCDNMHTVTKTVKTFFYSVCTGRLNLWALRLCQRYVTFFAQTLK